MQRDDLLARRSSPSQAITAGAVIAALGLVLLAMRLVAPASAFDDSRGAVATVLAPVMAIIGIAMVVDGLRRRR